MSKQEAARRTESAAQYGERLKLKYGPYFGVGKAELQKSIPAMIARETIGNILEVTSICKVVGGDNPYTPRAAFKVYFTNRYGECLYLIVSDDEINDYDAQLRRKQ